MRRKHKLLMGIVLLGAPAMASTAQARSDVYEYRIIHPSFGDIGRYRNVIEQRGDDTDVHSELTIAVKILGVTMWRQEASREERWHGDRLVAFDGVTTTNGARLPIHGESRDGGFAVTTPAGTVLAPANVHPSNPWSAMVLQSDVLMSTRSGKVMKAVISGGEIERVTLAGTTRLLHQYEIIDEKHQLVWLDDEGVPVAFRAEFDGTAVDFVLDRRPPIATARLPGNGR